MTSSFDPAPASAHPQGRAVRIGRVVNNRKLRRAQHINALIASLAGVAGVVGAFVLAITVKPVSWFDVAVFLLFFCLVGLGVTLGFHRHFTHHAFKAGNGVRTALAILGCAAGQGPLVFWVSLHRLHHEFADHEGDPHSPNLSGSSLPQRLRGLLYAYIGWTVMHDVPNANYYARDLLKDREMMTVNRYYYLWVVLGLILPAAIVGTATASWIGALEGLLWGGLVRMFAFHNAIWWITCFAHSFGKRDFETRDLSRNISWIAVPTLGESWHNNHHGFPSAADLRFEWWQIDITGSAAVLLEKLGLAWNLYRPPLAARNARRIGVVGKARPPQQERTE